jgi:Cation transporter/ATPase, N-terminus
VDKYGLIPLTSVFARFRRWSSVPTERSVAHEKTLIEVAQLSLEEALRRLSSSADGLARDEVEKRLRSVGQTKWRTRHTTRSLVRSSADRSIR